MGSARPWTKSFLKLRCLIAAVLVGLASFGGMVLWSYFDCYYLSPPNWKFGRDMDFQLRVFASGWFGFCFAVGLVATAPLYVRCFPGRGIWHLATYSVAFSAAFSTTVWSEPVGLAPVAMFIGTHFIPEFSGSGLLEIMLSFFAAILLAAALFFCGAFVVDRCIIRFASL